MAVAEGVEAATLRDEMSERLQQGGARWAIAAAEAGAFIPPQCYQLLLIIDNVGSGDSSITLSNGLFHFTFQPG